MQGLTVVKNITKVGVLWLGVVGSIASIYGIRKDLVSGWSSVNWTTLKVLVSEPLVIVSSAVAVPLVVVAFAVYRNLRVRGGISARVLARRFDPFLQSRIIYEIHTLQHQCCQLRRWIKPRRARGLALLVDDDFRALAFDFLNQCKRIVDLATGTDAAVHVKLFAHKTSGATGNIPLKDAVLTTWLRVPSARERALRETGTLRARENDEVFKIITGTKGHANRMAQKAVEFRRGRKRVNSAYNHVFGNTEHFFVCNDLPAAAASGAFFSTSANFEDYYRSLAVFLVNANIAAGAPVDHQPVWGVFVIDSYETKRFEVNIMRAVGGYMAHRIYEVLDQLT